MQPIYFVPNSDGVEVKLCISCKVKKPRSEFHKSCDLKSGYESRCRPCRGLDNKRLKQKDPEKYRRLGNAASERWRERHPVYRRESYTRKRFGMPSSEVDAFVQDYVREHGTVCMACKQTCVVVGRVKEKGKRRLVLDHDHTTGKLRGMLCDFCNTALGKLGDSKEGIIKLLTYIERFN